MRLKRKLEKRDIVNVTAFLLFAAFIVFLGMEYMKVYGEIKGDSMLATAENLRQYLLSYGNAGLWIMTSLHALHVIVAFIPAALIQFAGSAIYGMTVGMLIGVVGMAVGTAITFYISRFLGKRMVTLFVGEKHLGKLEDKLSGGVSAVMLLFLFIIPFPKDFIAYFMGFTNIKASKFFLISAVGRLPGMLITSYLGAHVIGGEYKALMAVTGACGLLMALLFIYKNRIWEFMSRKRRGQE